MDKFLITADSLIKNPTFWAALAAFAALFAACGVFYAARQIKLSGWIKAQEIFTNKIFIDARGEILKHFGYDDSYNIPSRIGQSDEETAMMVCRKMDELSRLKLYLGKKLILKAWGYPLGKTWMILEATVNQERKFQPKKWDAFEKLGKAAGRKFHLRDLNHKMFMQKQSDMNPQLEQIA